MKIQSELPQNFGQLVMFDTVEVKFDRLGIADVKPNEAEWMVKNYPGWISLYDQDAKPAVKVDLVGVEKELAEAIKKHELALEAKASEVTALSKELGEWKKANGELVASEAKAVKESTTYKIYADKKIEELEFNILLLGTDIKGLKEICAKLNIPTAKWEGLNKTDLVVLIMETSVVK